MTGLKNLSRKKTLLNLSGTKKTVIMQMALVIALSPFSFCVSHNTKSVEASGDLPAITLKVQEVATNLEALTAMAFPGNGDIWVTEQKGKIRLIRNGKLIDLPLLDLKTKLTKINNGYEERGFLGLTLHPRFKSNGKFYVCYSAPSNQKSDNTEVLAEYTLTAGSDQVDPNSGRIILSLEDPEGNHNGGCIAFGPDGYLYISFGDGGGQHDKHGEIGNGQNLDTWLGKILRIDIDTNTGYNVPKDNPFVGKPNVKPEIWAYGFRNVWRFSFDKASGQLFAGEVGQDNWEEVDIINKGANYGWRILEGTHCHNPATGCDSNGITMPITEYSHKEGVSVTGGYVYNGKLLTDLKSKYLFADWTGPMFYLQKDGANWQRGNIVLQNIPPNLKITSFGEDEAGELYILTNPDTGPGNTNGIVFKIVKN